LIDNGPRNFTTAPLHEELERCLVEARDSGSRVVVIGSAVPGYFIGHGDIGDIVNNLTGGEPTGDPRAFLRLLRELDTGPMVSLAAIEGQAWGGGFLLALSCDFRAASRSSTFGQPEIMAGVTTAGEAVRISRMAGEAAARRLLLDGRPIDGSEAHRLGLVDRLAAEGSVLAEAITWAEWLTQRPAGDLARVKRGLLAGRDLPMPEALKAETARFVECFADPTIVARLTEVQRRYDAGADSYDAFGIPRTRQPHESG
jgi:enoyl-CoA hydratase